MGFRDPFQYRTRSEIDKGWPDLHTGNKEWNLKKIYKVKTSCLKLMLNIKELFDVRMDTVWLSQLYFQRYFSQNSFQTNTAVVFITACVHMACKANDQPRPLDTVIKKTYRLRYSRDPMESKKIDDIMVFVEYKVSLSAMEWLASCPIDMYFTDSLPSLAKEVCSHSSGLPGAAGTGVAGRASTAICFCL